MRLALGLLVVTACYRANTTEVCTVSCTTASDCPSDLACNNDGLCSPNGDRCGDPNPDADNDGNGGTFCAGDPAGLLGKVCFVEIPTPTEFPPNVASQIDTDGASCIAIPLQMNACLVVVERIDGSVSAIGSRPLVLWALEDLTLGAGLDVASHSSNAGPGANPPSCTTTNTDGSLTGSVGGGGAGGSFGSLGGNGGGVGGIDSLGGEAAGVPTDVALRGGCPGGSGAASPPLTTRGLGGGAVYLMAGNSIRVTSTASINASGGHGLAAASRGGGGGGGSGGMIGFDAPTIVLDGIVIALGGGGASGGSNGIAGIPGFEPQLMAPHPAPVTDSLGQCAGFGFGGGGSDGFGNVLPSREGMSSCGGGGGGGGDGVIRAFGSMPTGTGTVLPGPVP